MRHEAESRFLTSELPASISETQVLQSRYYVATIDRLMALLGEAGFVGAKRLDDVLSHPVLLARRPNAA